MADVSDRGQLILVLGVVVGTIFVVLVLLLNTVIFTENLASRGADFGDRDAIEYRGTIADALEELLAEENARGHGTDDAVRANVSDGVAEADTILRERYAKRGVAVNISNTTQRTETNLTQTDATREMTNESGTINWTLVTGTDEFRNFRIDVADQSALHSTGDPENEAAGAFNVSTVGSANRWSLYVYENTSPATPRTELAVKNGSDATPSTNVCGSAVSNTPRIDLLAGTVDGNACPAIEFGKDVTGAYDVSYTFGNRTAGTYNLTVNVSGGGSVERTNFNHDGETSPYEWHATYRASVDAFYRTSTLRYRARLNATPAGGST